MRGDTQKKIIGKSTGKKITSVLRRDLQNNMIPKRRNISIVWDFDKTLTKMDSTEELIKVFLRGSPIEKFWKEVKKLSGTQSDKPMNSISTSDTPVWMYRLSELSKDPEGAPIGLNEDNIQKLIVHKIDLYSNVLNFLQKIQDLSKDRLYQENNIEIHHFIITAGLKDLVSAVFKYHNSSELIKEVFGCKYNTAPDKMKQNIPVYFMDKTTKVRALFEICKGCFLPDAEYAVDDLVPEEKKWCPFENMIYIGDGDTDIPAFSLVQSRKGMTIGVFDPSLPKKERDKKAENMRKGKRIDLFTPACFEKDGELYRFIEMRCRQIAKRYEARIKESS